MANSSYEWQLQCPWDSLKVFYEHVYQNKDTSTWKAYWSNAAAFVKNKLLKFIKSDFMNRIKWLIEKM